MAWLVTAFEISVVLAALGLLTRLATLTAFVLGLSVLGLQFNYGYLHWAHAIVPIVMGILALSPCGDGFSLDAVILDRVIRAQSSAEAGGQYRWPIQLVRLVFVSVFLAAGLAKLRQAGLEWVLSDTLRNYFFGKPICLPIGRGCGLEPPAGGLADRPSRPVQVAGRCGACGGTQPLRQRFFHDTPRRWLIPALFAVPNRQRAAAVPGLPFRLPGALSVLDTVGAPVNNDPAP